LRGLPAAVIKQMNAECFEINMVDLMNSKVEEELNKFQTMHFKLEKEKKAMLHAWTQQLLLEQVETLQLEWDRQNKPLMILKQNEERYKQMISTRLEYGFTFQSEGLIIAEALTTAIVHKTITSVSDLQTQSFKGLIWTTNSEKVRLEYFIELAEEVSSGNKARALQHFANPQTEIERWYDERIRLITIREIVMACIEKLIKLNAIVWLLALNGRPPGRNYCLQYSDT
jgi:hypothetical protein